jgi:DNA-binding XRE family transcriptional regulator
MITENTTIRTTDLYLRKAIYKAHKGKCFYTGEHLDFNLIEIDHIIPKYEGGTNTILNYVLTSRKINGRKSKKYEKEICDKLQLLNKLLFVPSVIKEYNNICYENKILKIHNNINRKNELLEKAGFYNIIEKVVFLRKQANFSQQFMAEWLNVDRRKIIELEYGNCTIELLLLYAEKLDYPIFIQNEKRTQSFF